MEESIYHKQSGIITLEVLMALAIITVVISAAILVVFGNQSLATDSLTNNEAIMLAQAEIEKSNSSSYDSVNNSNLGTLDIYNDRTISINPDTLTQCSKDVTSHVGWEIENRPMTVDLITRLTDTATALALGGTCDSSPPTGGGWNPPSTWNCDNFNPGKPTGLDVLNKIVYMTADKSPYLEIANVSGAPLNSNCSPSHLFVNFNNHFSSSVKLNDIVVAKASNNRIYAFVAQDSSTNQLGVIDVTDINNPVLIGTKTLASASGSFPQGWRVYYFDQKVYIVTRETAGNEFHVFNASTPWNIASINEYGTGKALDRTVEQFVITKKLIGGTWRYFAYMATDKDSAELSVFEVTNPLSVNELINADVDLTGNQDGMSICLVGNNLYLGRQSASGSDLFVFDSSDPSGASGGLPKKNQVDIGTGVIGIAVSGPYAFLATTKTNSEFQVWTSNPSVTITKVNSVNFNFPNVIENGLKYEDNWVYVASQGNDALRIIYNGQ